MMKGHNFVIHHSVFDIEFWFWLVQVMVNDLLICIEKFNNPITQ
jgi:hypothetical protein